MSRRKRYKAAKAKRRSRENARHVQECMDLARKCDLMGMRAEAAIAWTLAARWHEQETVATIQRLLPALGRRGPANH